jgi:dTDP-glucose 4,6-dehydratase/UDP-glucuronate decarboxylase
MPEQRPEELDLATLGTHRGAVISPVLREDAEAVVEELGALMAPLSGKAILVTGAAGFLCSHLLDVLAAFNARAASSGSTPCQVIALDNFKIGLPSRVAHLEKEEGFLILDHDVTRPFPADLPADYVIHGAGIASPTFYRRFPLETIAVNVDGLRHTLDHARARGSQRAIYLSTSEIYGDPDPAHIPTPESYRGSVSCTGPRACYDESKRLGETIAMVLRRKEGLPVRVLRPFNVYGPGQRLDDQRIVPDMMRSALAGRPLVLLSDGRATRSFCYLRDAIRGILFALFSPSEHAIFNVGNDEGEVPMRSLAEAVAEVAAPPTLAVRYQKSEDADYLVDNPQRRCPDLGRLRGLGYAPTVPLREGLARTLASYRSLVGGS